MPKEHGSCTITSSGAACHTAVPIETTLAPAQRKKWGLPMTKRMGRIAGLSLQLGAVAAAAVALATAPAHALLVCTVNADAKNIPIYDKPGGAEVRRADADPAWKSGPAQPAHEQGGAGMMEMWIEIQDASGGVVGFAKVGDGSAACKGGF